MNQNGRPNVRVVRMNTHGATPRVYPHQRKAATHCGKHQSKSVLRDEISIDGNWILDYSSPLGRGGVISGGLVSPMPPATPTGCAHLPATGI